MCKFLLVFFMVGAAAFVYKYLEHANLSQTIIARVSLQTNCELDPKAFAVKNIKTNHGDQIYSLLRIKQYLLEFFAVVLILL